MTGVNLSMASGKWRRTFAMSTALSAFAVSGIAFSAGAMENTVPATPAQAATSELAQASQQHDFDIARQPLADALALFGQQAGLQISAHGDLVRDVQTNGVVGLMNTEAALQRLLAGTGLVYRIADDGSVTITSSARSSDASETMVSPILIEAASVADDRPGAADRANSVRVTREDLDRRNPQDVKQVFAGESGVSVGGSLPMNQKIYVNGIEETNLAVSIDGARQNNKVFHHNGTTLIDPSLLKAVRVDPGVAPADAGAGALGGAIVYETVDVDDVLEPGRSLGGYVKASYDTNSKTFANDLASYGRAGNLELLGYFKWAKGDDFESGDGEQMLGTGADLRSGLMKGAYDAKNGHRFELSAEQVRDRASRPYRANMTSTTDGAPVAPERLYDLQRRNLSFNYNTPDAQGLWDPKFVLAYSETNLGVPEPYGSDAVTGSYSGKFENDFNLTDHDTITGGVDFYRDNAEYKDPDMNTEEVATNFGVYTQARIQPLDPLRLSFGLRGDKQYFEGIDGTEIDQEGLSGNVSAAYDVTDFLTLNAGYSNVWGGVALAENFIHRTNWDYSDGIKPVRAENYTTGFEAHYEGFTFNAGLFRSVFDNARSPGGAGPGITTDFETRGYDVGTGYNWGPGFVRVSYTDTEITVNSGAASSYATQYFGAPLGRVIALEAAHRFDDIGVLVGGNIDAALKNTDTVKAGGQALEAYEVFNLYAEYQPEAAEFLTLRFEVNNLFDENYADRATYGQDFASVTPLYEPGRSFLLMAKARF